MADATEEDVGQWMAPKGIGAGVPTLYEKNEPIADGAHAWTLSTGVMIHGKHPQLKDFPDEEYDKLDVPAEVMRGLTDYKLVRPKKATPVAGSRGDLWYG
jgi:hypothetical protein